ncbi:MAG: hypothetical protein WDZ79_01065 [Candidatus Paceibacterota bacterium]
MKRLLTIVWFLRWRGALLLIFLVGDGQTRLVSCPDCSTPKAVPVPREEDPDDPYPGFSEPGAGWCRFCGKRHRKSALLVREQESPPHPDTSPPNV